MTAAFCSSARERQCQFQWFVSWSRNFDGVLGKNSWKFIAIDPNEQSSPFPSPSSVRPASIRLAGAGESQQPSLPATFLLDPLHRAMPMDAEQSDECYFKSSQLPGGSANKLMRDDFR
ncbi:hypothetical protein E2562_031196 [Oryza meyeriana var. granulata]|uniref:Uncharacterized protein n=1 Tax=Oryza meyeriana var. granulata TaxID=110450 RepID=A0A6G1ERP7_9ORYZ|nr:hypothetical protein E2562_031196 [Oryza meyeriana var. granulata]